MGLGLEVIFRRTEGQGSDGLHSLSLPPTPIFSPSTLICVLVSLSLLMGRRGEKRRPNQTANSFGRREPRELSTRPPPFPSSPRSCPLDSFIKRHHSDALRGRRFCTIVQGGPTEWRPELELIIILCFVPQMRFLFTLLLRPCLFCFCLQILPNGSALSFSSAWGLAVSREGLGRSEIVV